MSEEKHIKVLLVDDEETLVEYMAKRLLREGFMVRATNSGEEALAAALDEDFDVAIVDIKMPGMDGVETQHKLKEIRPYIECIVLTGHASLESALESGREDAFQYLRKPLDHDELVQTVTAAGEKKRDTQRSRFREEMQDAISRETSPRAIIEAVNALRKKFCME